MNSSRVHLEEFAERAALSLDGSARVLDAGAGNCPYRSRFDHVVYHATDFGTAPTVNRPITYASNLSKIPIGDCQYDLVLFTQVLEHLFDPLAVLRELNRVLKPGGELWLSTPLFYEEHSQPHDYYRYTQFGLSYLLDEAGFEIIEIDWLEGYLGTLAYEFELASRCLPMNSGAYGGGAIGASAASSAVFLRPTLLVLSIVLSRLDIRTKFTSAGHCKNYAIVAKKIAVKEFPYGKWADFSSAFQKEMQ